MGKKLTTEDFIKRSKKVHGDKYDYSLVNYISSKIKIKIKIICKKHGEFKQIPDDHLNGSGCAKCSKNYKYTTEEFIKKLKEVHGNKYDYSLVNYKNSETNIIIICKKHGEFKQSAWHHLNGSNCPECSNVKKHTTESFIKKSKKVHNGKYNYSLVKYMNNYTKVKIICPKHGEFEQIPKHHLNGVGCKSCNESKGEKIISKLLTEKNITYEREKTFKKCKSKLKLLQFDFYLSKSNTCIEFDGIQHFKPIEWFGGIDAFNKRKKYDKIKDNFCKENNINLIRIRYDENVNDKLGFLK